MSYKKPDKVIGYIPSVLGLVVYILNAGVAGLKFIAEVEVKEAEYVKGPHSAGKELVHGPAAIETRG